MGPLASQSEDWGSDQSPGTKPALLPLPPSLRHNLFSDLPGTDVPKVWHPNSDDRRMTGWTDSRDCRSVFSFTCQCAWGASHCPAGDSIHVSSQDRAADLATPSLRTPAVHWETRLMLINSQITGSTDEASAASP